MDERNGRGTDGSGTPVVHWTVYEVDGYVHAVADVPQRIPKGTIGFGATDTTAAVFLGPAGGRGWKVTLPVPVNPLPESISYNNGVVEAVFRRADPDHVASSADSTYRAA